MKGQVTRNSGTLQALTKDAHRGYQTWHRDLDDDIVNWITKNEKASLSMFTDYMNELYCAHDMVERFEIVYFG